MPEPLSAVIIARNEEENIARCIKSLTWTDEIIVVDSESTDSTREIAEGLGARVIVQPWLGLTEQYRFAVSQARTPWVLVVDADEEITDELKEEIKHTLAGNPSYAAYRVPRINFALGHWLRFGGWREKIIRLFLNDKAQYLPVIHPRLKIDGKVGTLSHPMRHYMCVDFGQWLLRSLSLARIEAETSFSGGARFSGLKVLAGFWKFFRRYIFKLGFIHGWAGLICCLQRFIYIMTQQAVLLELQLGIRKPSDSPHKATFR